MAMDLSRFLTAHKNIVLTIRRRHACETHLLRRTVRFGLLLGG
jgi:hypothetical protein